ncbi:MAG: serine hydrolase [Eubacteriales bacterium]|nr:serine hydrolase [Eubacteriales bacterium]
MRKFLQKKKCIGLTAMVISGSMLSCAAVSGAGSLLTVTEEARIAPMPDGSGKYLLKSDGYYCLDENGTQSTIPEVHYFDEFHIGDEVLNGYYYHGPEASFTADGYPVVALSNVKAKLSEEEEVIFDGLYLLNENGLLNAEPQVRYMDNLNINGQVYNGYYYFNELGQMVTNAGMHELHMECHGEMFDGLYYFGGTNGVLPSEAGENAEGVQYDEHGLVTNLDSFTMEHLRYMIRKDIAQLPGTWAVYVKNMNTGESMTINNRAFFSASVIKAFAMEHAYANMMGLYVQAAKKLNTTPDNEAAINRVATLLTNMITVSDNESFNEIVRLSSANNDFCEGAEDINEYLQNAGYEHTLVQHTLAPSASAEQTLGGRNMTSVADCGLLLERIYKGECVSPEASEAMLGLLSAQKFRSKIPAGIKNSNVKIANKTGETNEDQHDIAIVYGESTDYVICLMSEQCPEAAAVQNIQRLSGLIYEYMETYAFASQYGKFGPNVID